MSQFSISRRQVLLGATALAGSAALQVPVAHAKAPLSNTQAPYFYRFNHGKMQMTVVSDGILPLGEPSGSFLGSSKEEIGKMLTDNFLSTTNVVLEQNVLVVNTGDKLVLIDTGMGTSQMFGPTPGKLLASLKAAGIDPKDIDAILATHAHCDHVWGIMADDGSRHFPNAQIYMSQADFDFWTDEKKLALKDLRPTCSRSWKARASTFCRTGTGSCSSRTARSSCPASRRWRHRGIPSATPST